MAWIELHAAELAGHHKTRKAASRLRITVPTLIGHLTILWAWALDHADDGDLSDWDNEDIALAAAWPDDPDAFVDALVSCGKRDGAGFLERDGSYVADVDPETREPVLAIGSLVIHDWWAYAGKLIARRRHDRRRKRQARAGTPELPFDQPPEPPEPPAESHETPRPADVPRTSHGRPADSRLTVKGVEGLGVEHLKRRNTHTTGARATPAKPPPGPLPDDWQPTLEHRRIATAEGIDLQREAQRFRAHAKAKNRQAADWHDAFTSWLLDGLTRANQARASPNGARPPPPQRQVDTTTADPEGLATAEEVRGYWQSRGFADAYVETRVSEWIEEHA